jgi:hypothetical protein
MRIKFKPAFYFLFSVFLLTICLCLEILMMVKPEYVLRWMKVCVFSLLGVLSCNLAFGFVYGEHKVIGDQAFIRMMKNLKANEGSATLSGYMDKLVLSQSSVYVFPRLSASTLYLTSYGMLNGLAGDHQSDPVLLEAQLKDPGSILQKIIALHKEYIDKGLKAAPDAALVGIDLKYALTAAVNLSHFYAYGKSFTDQLKGFDKEKIRQACDRAYLSALVRHLSSTNAIKMYVSLHLIAINTAEQSGKMARLGDQDGALDLLQAALFLNGFADHFLEDSFSSGHLVVNRTVLASFTNNKALHDFYSEHGTRVVNRKGEIWKAYGDGQFEENSPDGERIVTAVQASLQDLMVAFNTFFTGEKKGFLDKVPDQKESQPLYLIEHIPSLSFVPIPYNSELRDLMLKNVVLTDQMREANQLLYYRNFIRSRVGNSFVFSGITEISRPVTGFELRLNAVNFSKRYEYNPMGGKKGMLDSWHGYTLSYQLTKNREGNHELSSQISGGLRSNFDYWFSNKRFLGLYSYLESGLRFEQGSTDVIFAPSLGIHLGSLFNINYYNMPSWLRIPTMYLLPLKVRYGPVFSLKQRPRYYASVEMDVFF